jgi:chemotaxis protein MotB
MSRKKKPAEPENHERWMVSYADFITLLFAFFVVMFASSQADKGKAKQVSESVRRALEDGQVSAVLAGIMGAKPSKKPGPMPAATTPTELPKPGELKSSFVDLAQALKAELDAGKIKLTMEPRGLVVSLLEAAFFGSGDAVINPQALPSIEKIAAAINRIPNQVRLEGHTDSRPIHNSRFRNNWELSAARGIAMLELLSVRFDVQTSRMAIAGYAENVPVDSNETEVGRARNRRVDIVLLSPIGMQPEPQAAKPEPAKAAPPQPAPKPTR